MQFKAICKVLQRVTQTVWHRAGFIHELNSKLCVTLRVKCYVRLVFLSSCCCCFVLSGDVSCYLFSSFADVEYQVLQDIDFFVTQFYSSHEFWTFNVLSGLGGKVWHKCLIGNLSMSWLIDFRTWLKMDTTRKKCFPVVLTQIFSLNDLRNAR